MGELDGKIAVITGAGSGMAQRLGRGVRARGRQGPGRRHHRQARSRPRPSSATPSSRSAATSPTRRRSRPCSPRPSRCSAASTPCSTSPASPTPGRWPRSRWTDYDRIMDVDLRGVLLGTKHGIRAMLPTGGGVIANWSSTGGLNGSTMPDQRLLGGQGRRHRLHQGGRGRVRHPGHPGQRHLPRLRRDRDVGRQGRRRAVPRPRVRARRSSGAASPRRWPSWPPSCAPTGPASSPAP